MEVFMRQGGFVPKNHDSGVYWVRANAGSGGENKEKEGTSAVFWLFVWCLIVLVGSWID
tara:strand:+ start:1070 stop:1246 length:177 start_codon:yes stop_codon:yes gene_type:complete